MSWNDRPIFIEADIPVMKEGRPTDWIATCGVCEHDFAVRDEDSSGNPAPNGSFCPDCRATNLIAPGVLHWSQRGERY